MNTPKYQILNLYFLLRILIYNGLFKPVYNSASTSMSRGIDGKNNTDISRERTRFARVNTRWKPRFTLFPALSTSKVNECLVSPQIFDEKTDNSATIRQRNITGLTMKC